MQGWLDPIGPEAPSVYWTRRGVVLAVLLAVVVGIGWLAGRPGAITATPSPSTPSVSSSPTSSVSTTPSATPSTPSPSEQPSASVSPGEQSVQPSVEPSAEQSATAEPTATESVPAGCQPTNLKLRVDGPDSVSQLDTTANFRVVVSTTEQGCQLDLGAAAAALAITSGNDEVWETENCADWHPAGVLDLVSGEESGFDVNWPVKRSHGCELSDEVLGVGTYVATASIGQASARLVMQVRY